ncbi:MAG: D-cysteine desulfhydrase family protein [Euryarchaeota archaeon]|nr:D-cysteine desulfhydrase family protein [Euryarchaeota archaeon]
MDINAIPRKKVGRLPTPLERIPNFSKAIELPNLYIKRDDMTGIGYGGNKIRKLEFLLADAMEKGADTVITTGGVQSNFTRETTACAAKLGLKTVLVLIGEEPKKYRGNLLLEKLMGADIHFVSAEDLDEGAEKAEDLMRSLSEELEEKKHNCYIMPVGGATPIGCLGFAKAFLEMHEQAKKRGITPDYIISATGSGGTQAGLVVGKKMTDSDARIAGIRVGWMFEPYNAMVAEMAQRTADLLNIKKPITEEDVTTYTDFIGDGYDIPTKEANNAIELMARTEAIFLDPVYTGKAMAGLIGLLDRGEISRDDTVVFWHTGGDIALFVGEELLGKEFMEELKR